MKIRNVGLNLSISSKLLGNNAVKSTGAVGLDVMDTSALEESTTRISREISNVSIPHEGRLFVLSAALYD